MRFKYCPDCGTQLFDKELENEGMIPFCSCCNEYKFPKYNVAVSMVVVCEETNEILLIKQYGKPFYILVAGYVNQGEPLEDAVKREVFEETGLKVYKTVFNKTKYFAMSDTLMCNFIAYIESKDDFNSNYEIDSSNWFSYSEARKNIRSGSLAEEFLLNFLNS